MSNFFRKVERNKWKKKCKSLKEKMVKDGMKFNAKGEVVEAKKPINKGMNKIRRIKSNKGNIYE